MTWQIKTDHDRWLHRDDQGFYTTSQEKARVFTSKKEADETRDEAQQEIPAVSFEVVEVP